MGEATNISWCDSTHNFWRGCTKISPGCTNCYAETLVTTRLGGQWGKGKPRVRAKDFDAPLRWNKKPWVCETCGEAVSHREAHSHDDGFHRRRVFSLSLGDWLDAEVRLEWLADMLDVIRRCPDLDFLLLTKRPENWKARSEDLLYKTNLGSDFTRWLEDWIAGIAPRNIWLGVSVEDQQRADERIPELLKIPAEIRFLSAEPLLGPIDLNYSSFNGADSFGSLVGIDWIIFGGESGPGARHCDIEWIRDGLRQCKAAGVAAFVKQLGSKPINRFARAENDTPVEYIMPLKDRKGGDMSEWPEDLRVRQWPAIQAASSSIGPKPLPIA